jgi:hypothetical protein
VSVPARLAAFVAGLAVVFAATFTAGTALAPDDDDRPGPTTSTTTHAPDHDPSGHQDGSGS